MTPKIALRLPFLLLFPALAGSLGCDPGGEIAQPGTLPVPDCSVECTGGVSFAAELAVTPADAPNLVLELCRNNLCSTLHPTARGTAFECDFADPLPEPIQRALTQIGRAHV